MTLTHLTVHPPQTVSMMTRDGVRLDADVYRPQAPGDYPVLLMRQPYGRRIASTLCYAHPSWYAARGYIVAIQDVRGRGSSEGQFALFTNEAQDGADAVAWAAALPGSTGAVGMYGFSYQGVTQLLAAGAGTPGLKAVAPAMIGWDLRNDWAYENDAFCLSAGMSWAIQLAAETARLAGDLDAHQALHAASRALPLNNTVVARPAVMEAWRKYDPHYFDWLDQPADAAYWDAISPSAQAETLTTKGPPALFIGGWYDTHLPGTIAGYRRYEAAGADSRLIIGPWAHFPWGRRVGELDFGEAALGEIDQLQIAWFDHWLKGRDPAPMADAPVRLFDMGARAWTDLPAWPTTSETWRLGGGGRVALDERDGVLAKTSVSEPGADPIVHDPWRPVPSLGGAFSALAGPVDRTAIDARPDVLTYTSAPLETPLTLVGESEALLAVACDVQSLDLSCVLSRVGPGGDAMLIAEGYRHFKTPPDEARIPLRATCITLQPGERLRLSVAGASFPNHPVNPGDGQNPTRARLGEGRIATITLLHDGAGSCRLFLPVAS